LQCFRDRSEFSCCEECTQGGSGIQSAWIFGSFAKNEADASSDIDLLIVGQPNQTQLASETRKAEKILRREINYTVFTLRNSNAGLPQATHLSRIFGTENASS